MDHIRINNSFKSVNEGLEIPDLDFCVFIGTNNSGKTSLLRSINISLADEKSIYVPPQRFNVSSKMTSEHRDGYQNYKTNDYRKSRRANESNELELTDFIQLLAGARREHAEILLNWINENFDVHISRHDDKTKYSTETIVEIDGESPDKQGSGIRALLNLLIQVVDTSSEYVLIDEPEISIEPIRQKKVFRFLKKISRGEIEGLERKKIYIATHSHLFLDRDTPSNNFVVRKNEANETYLERLNNEQELYTKLFTLMGITPDDLFLPTNIVIVEGHSDEIFIRKVLDCKKSSNRIAIHYADSDTRISGATKSIDDLLKVTVNPGIPLYRNNMCVLFDLQDDNHYIENVKSELDDPNGERVVQLAQKGIEYYYPKNAVAQITGLDEAEVEKAIIQYLTTYDDEHQLGKIGAVKISKVEFAEKVTAYISTDNIQNLDRTILDFLNKCIEMAIS